MSNYQCKRCGVCLSSKRRLTEHLNKKKPCVPAAEKTDYQCDRCLKCLSTKQQLTIHKNRKVKCEVYRHIPIVKTDLVKEMELEENKDIMIIAMKKEYYGELRRIYKLYGSQIQCASKRKAILDKKLKDNIKKLKERKSIPDKMFSVIPDKKTQVDTVNNLMKRYKQLKTRICKAEQRISEVEDEHEDGMIGMTDILNNTMNDRDKLLEITKELRKQVDKNTLRVIMNAEVDIAEDDC